MRHALTHLIVLILGLSSLVYEQPSAESVNPVILGFSTIGSVSSPLISSLLVEVRETNQPKLSVKSYEIRLGSKGGLFADVSYESIDVLLKGLDYLNTIDKSATRLDTYAVTVLYKMNYP